MEHAESIKNIAETAAWVCAGIFFIYRALTGYLVTNMSLSVSCTRQSSKRAGNDLVRVVVLLSKGPSGTIALHDIQATVRVGSQEPDLLSPSSSATSVPHDGSVAGAGTEGKPAILEFSSTERLSFESNSAGRKVIKWNKPSQANPFMHLSPGEATQFATFCEVPTGRTCTIDVAVLGKVLWTPTTSQWRASDVSMPLLAPSDA